MTKQVRRETDADGSRIENARVGYQTTIDLYNMESEALHARFNAMILANSIMIGGIGLAIAGQRPLYAVACFLSFIGLPLCILWAHMTRRGFDYANYLIKSACELEEHYLGDIVQTLSRGGDFEKGKKVEMQISDPDYKPQMSWFARRRTTQRTMFYVIVLFGVLYAGIILMLFVNQFVPIR